MTPPIGRCQLRPAAGQSRAGLPSELGTSTVEFALSASLLFMLVIGTVYMAWALYSYNIVSEAAREAVRYAIVRGADCHFGSPCTPATKADLQTYVEHLGFPGSSKMVVGTPVWAAYPAGGTCANAGCNGPGNQITVTVTLSFPVVIPFVPHRTLSMSNTAALVISQ